MHRIAVGGESSAFLFEFPFGAPRAHVVDDVFFFCQFISVLPVGRSAINFFLFRTNPSFSIKSSFFFVLRSMFACELCVAVQHSRSDHSWIHKHHEMHCNNKLNSLGFRIYRKLWPGRKLLFRHFVKFWAFK